MKTIGGAACLTDEVVAIHEEFLVVVLSVAVAVRDFGEIKLVAVIAASTVIDSAVIVAKIAFMFVEDVVVLVNFF